MTRIPITPTKEAREAADVLNNPKLYGTEEFVKATQYHEDHDISSLLDFAALSSVRLMTDALKKLGVVEDRKKRFNTIPDLSTT